MFPEVTAVMAYERSTIVSKTTLQNVFLSYLFVFMSNIITYYNSGELR